MTELLLGGQAELTNGALRMPGGILVRGNLRASREEAFDTAEAAIKRMFGASYVATHHDAYPCSTPIESTPYACVRHIESLQALSCRDNPPVTMCVRPCCCVPLTVS